MPRQHLLLTRIPGKIPRFTDHALPMALDVKQGIQKLSFPRRCLMNPGEHVTDVARGVVGVQFDRTRESVWSASSEGFNKGLQEEGLACRCEQLQSIAVHR